MNRVPMAQVPIPSIEIADTPSVGGTCLTCLRELSEHQIECPEHELLALLWPPNNPKFETDGIHTLSMERDFLSTCLEYLRLCADELQKPLSTHRVLHLPGPTQYTLPLYANPWSWKFHWSASLQPKRPIENWGFRFGRSGVTIMIDQVLPPISQAIQPSVTPDYYSPSSLLVLMGYESPPQSQSQSPSQSQPPQSSPPQEQQQEAPPFQPFTITGPSIQRLDRATCLSEWHVLRDLLRAEIPARERNAANLNSVASLCWRVHGMSLDREDPMWCIITDMQSAMAREASALNVARRNLRSVERVFEEGYWEVPAGAGAVGTDDGMDIDGGGGDGGEGKGKGKEKETDGNGNGNVTQNDEVLIWTTRRDFVAACSEEWSRHRASGGQRDQTPVVVLRVSGDRHVYSIRCQLTG